VLIETPTPAPDPAVVADAVIAVRQGMPVRLRDVATVTEAPALRTGDALIQGRPGVLLSMSSQFGANTLSVSHALEQTLATLGPALKADGIEVYPALHRPANFIERALHDIQQSLLIAAVLILLVLFAFLRNWRSALLSFLAIPLSLVAAAVVLKGSATEAELTAHCRSSLSDFKCPKTIYIVGEIPRTATGKIQRRNVAAAIGGRPGA